MTDDQWWETHGGECDKIIDEGRAGHSHTENPYPGGTREHDAWYAGLRDCCRN